MAKQIHGCFQAPNVLSITKSNKLKIFSMIKKEIKLFRKVCRYRLKSYLTAIQGHKIEMSMTLQSILSLPRLISMHIKHLFET